MRSSLSAASVLLLPLLAAPSVRGQAPAPSSAPADPGHWGIAVTQVESRNADHPRPLRGYNLTVSWDHAFHTERNHDAAWVILKAVEAGGSTHVPLRPGSAVMLWKDDPSMPDAALEIPDDGRGLFVYPSAPYRGEVTYRLFVELDTAAVDRGELARGSVQGFGVEMVRVPGGPFTLGDPDTTALASYAFYRSAGPVEGRDTLAAYGGLYRVEAEDAPIPVGTGEGELAYRSDRVEYRGDRSGPIPAGFPKGVAPFYLMKYEVRQGDYAAFLNTVGSHTASVRFPGGTPAYRANGGTIRLEDGVFVADRPDQRMIFWHWDDMMAWADWAGLRPHTELEFTKAVRGAGEPVPHEYAWNTDSQDRLARRIDPADNFMKMGRGLELADLTDANRDVFGASYHWVFDLNGSTWEKVVTVGDPVGRAFTGNHGDGALDGYGFADVEGWPSGISGARGYGYRGGGHYGENWISETNPYPRIASRRFGAWSGGPRNVAYGFRAARTAVR